MQLNKATATILAMSLTALLTGCEAEQTEKDMLAEAQFCLDKATNSTSANACMSKIEGLTSTQAYGLRCAAGFISSGTTSPANLSQALNSLQDGGSTAGVLGVLAFDSQSLADSTFNNCNLSKDTGLSLIAAMAKTATVLNNFASGSGSLEAQFQTAITTVLNNLNGTPSQQTQAIASLNNIGGAIQSVYTTTCGGTTVVNTEICGSINGAIAAVPSVNINTSTPQQIGDALLKYWQNLNH